MAEFPVLKNPKLSVKHFDVLRKDIPDGAPHPLSVIQQKMLHQSQLEKKRMLAASLGTHATLRMDMDEFIIRQSSSFSRRIPHGLDVLLKRDQTIDMFDILNSEDPYGERIGFEQLEKIF